MGELAFRRIRALRDDDDISTFRSGNEANDAWLQKRSHRAAAEGTARTYVLPLVDGTICGYYALSAHSVVRASAVAGALRRNSPDPIPCILLGQLAVDQRYQGNSAGARLLQDAVRRASVASQIVAARALVVDPADGRAESFYAHFGFRPIASDSRRMYVKL